MKKSEIGYGTHATVDAYDGASGLDITVRGTPQAAANGERAGKPLPGGNHYLRCGGGFEASVVALFSSC
ncbi:MAG: hypothetical protein LBH14_05890 [Desulfobulbaceae bacterium]|nr:hypothetical protein [Desulfobulbaceae bacterium]